MVSRERCRRCQYWVTHSFMLGPHCSYMIQTGHSRLKGLTPEQIQRGECRCFQKYDGKRRGSKGLTLLPRSMAPVIRRVTETDVRLSKIDALAPMHYAKGLSDKDIAKRVGCSKEGVRNWRYRNHLPSNFLQGGRKRRKEDKDGTEGDEV